MTIDVKDVFELDNITTFRLIAGSKGMGRKIESAGIADWEFANGIDIHAIKFEKNSLVISSLLFAREDTSLIYKAIEYLIQSGVSALAYKEIFIKVLPDEVIKLADRKNFPIFAFDTEFFEDILIGVHEAILASDQLRLKSEFLLTLINNDLPRADVIKTARKINNNFHKSVVAAYLSCEQGFKDIEVIRISENSNSLKKENYEIGVCCYQQGIMLIASSDCNDQKKYREVINNILIYTILLKENMTLGISSLRHIEELDDAANEAFNACIAAKVENKACLNYEDIGLYQFIIPNRDSDYIIKFMTEFLKPIIDQNNNQSYELLDTAIAFVNGGGDFKLVSEKLHVHENTLRYRLSKLHKILSAHSTDFQFYQSLAVAIKSYQVQNI